LFSLEHQYGPSDANYWQKRYSNIHLISAAVVVLYNSPNQSSWHVVCKELTANITLQADL
jgi:hypothetical protein